MNPLDLALWAFVLVCAGLAAYLHFRLRRPWAPALLLIAIGLAFLAHWLIDLGALQ